VAGLKPMYDSTCKQAIRFRTRDLPTALPKTGNPASETRAAIPLRKEMGYSSFSDSRAKQNAL
jgi:hypothetical protein